MSFAELLPLTFRNLKEELFLTEAEEDDDDDAGDEVD